MKRSPRCTVGKACMSAKLDSPGFVITSLLLTLVVLFVKDISLAACSVDCDAAVDVVLGVCLVFFAFEFFANIFLQHSYTIKSFFFWCDVLSLIAVVLDFSPIYEHLASVPNTDEQGSGASAILKATRLARIVARMPRLVRILRANKAVMLVTQISFLAGSQPGQPTARKLSHQSRLSASMFVMSLVVLVLFFASLTEVEQKGSSLQASTALFLQVANSVAFAPGTNSSSAFNSSLVKTEMMRTFTLFEGHSDAKILGFSADKIENAMFLQSLDQFRATEVVKITAQAQSQPIKMIEVWFDFTQPMRDQAVAAVLQTCWTITVFLCSAIFLHRQNRRNFVLPMSSMTTAIQHLGEIIYGKNAFVALRNNLINRAGSAGSAGSAPGLSLDFNQVDVGGLVEEELVELLMAKVNVIKRQLTQAEQMESVVGKAFTVQGSGTMGQKPKKKTEEHVLSLDTELPNDEKKKKDASSLVSNLANGMNLVLSKTKELFSKAGAAPSESKHDDHEAEKEESMRRSIIKEIVESEKTYVKLLSVVVNSVLLPLEKMSEDETHTGILKSSVQALFANLKEILALHSLVSEDLDPPHAGMSSVSGSHESPGERIARVYNYFSQTFTIYAGYVSNFDRSSKLLESLSAVKVPKSLRPLNAFLSACKAQIPMPLVSYLIMPIQRLPRYSLLLRELVKYTTVDIHKRNLEDAKDKIESVTKFLNETKRKVDKVAEVVAIEAKIKLPKQLMPLARRNRTLIDQRILLKPKSGRHAYIFLFNDVLLWTSSSFNFRCLIRLDHLMVVPGKQSFLKHEKYLPSNSVVLMASRACRDLYPRLKKGLLVTITSDANISIKNNEARDKYLELIKKTKLLHSKNQRGSATTSPPTSYLLRGTSQEVLNSPRFDGRVSNGTGHDLDVGENKASTPRSFYEAAGTRSGHFGLLSFDSKGHAEEQKREAADEDYSEMNGRSSMDVQTFIDNFSRM